jgi:hypothetical protein
MFLKIQMPLKLFYFKSLENIKSNDTTIGPTERTVRKLFFAIQAGSGVF